MLGDLDKMLGKIRTKVRKNSHKSLAEIFRSFLRGEFQEKNTFRTFLIAYGTHRKFIIFNSGSPLTERSNIN